MTYALEIPGEPIPQGSKSKGANGQLYERADLKQWRQAIAWTCRLVVRDAAPLDEAVLVVATFTLSKPKSSRDELARRKPDLDKLQRAVGDGLTDGRLLKDDSAIVAWIAEKDFGSNPGARLEIYTVGAEPATTFEARL